MLDTNDNKLMLTLPKTWLRRDPEGFTMLTEPIRMLRTDDMQRIHAAAPRKALHKHGGHLCA